MKNVFSGLTGSQRALALILLLVLIGIPITAKVNGLFVSALVSAVLMFLMWVTRFVWLPAGYGRNKIRFASITLAFGLAASHLFWGPIVGTIIQPLLHAHLPIVTNLPIISTDPSYLLLGFVFACVFVVNYFMRDDSIGGIHPAAIELEFPEKNYGARLKAFAGMLRDDLVRIDRETDWSPQYYAPIEAEIEIRTSRPGLTRVGELQRAILKDRKSRVFLLLGDPGSGKSVALRKLCGDMLREVELTNRVPIYINLREWLPTRSWDRKNPPTMQDLLTFVIETVKSKGDIFVEQFVDEYFEKMLEHGRLFLVFDSFDEIPAVLDIDDQDWLIKELSTLLFKFVAGAHESRGILASRIFRKPTTEFGATKVLEIRPFTEEKIASAMRRFSAFSNSLLRSLFGERQDLVPLARNPFLAMLLGNWVQQRRALPKNQAEMFRDYVAGRLQGSSARLQKLNLSADVVLAGAIELAWHMHCSPRLGLEAPIEQLDELVLSPNLNSIIDILVYARIGRKSGGESLRFTFVHRRFAEYFVALRLLERPNDERWSEIPTDSRWRDAFVLYAELADNQLSARLARFCWAELLRAQREGNVYHTIHCIRFLSDAYRARRGCLHDFYSDLTGFIFSCVTERENLLVAKFALEATGLLHPPEIERTVCAAIDQGNSWLSETAFKACRHLPRLSRQLEHSLVEYISRFSPDQVITRKSELTFSLALSDGFRQIRRFYLLRVIDAWLFYVGLITLSFLFPLLGLLFITVVPLILPFLSVVAAGPQVKVKDLARSLFRAPWPPEGAAFAHALRMVALMYLPIICTVLLMPRHLLPTATNEEFRILGLEMVDPSLTAGVLALICVLLIPWYLIYREIKYLEKKRYFKEKVFIALMGVILVGFILWGMSALSGYFFDVLPLLLVIAFFVLVVLVYFGLRPHVRSLFSDYYFFRHVVIDNGMTRADIAHALQGLQSGVFRRKFAAKLSSVRVTPTGKWPDERMFSGQLDQAMTMVAQLEERWLGLSI